jgi:hypothetical protein
MTYLTIVNLTLASDNSNFSRGKSKRWLPRIMRETFPPKHSKNERSWRDEHKKAKMKKHV